MTPEMPLWLAFALAVGCAFNAWQCYRRMKTGSNDYSRSWGWRGLLASIVFGVVCLAYGLVRVFGFGES